MESYCAKGRGHKAEIDGGVNLCLDLKEKEKGDRHELVWHKKCASLQESSNYSLFQEQNGLQERLTHPPFECVQLYAQDVVGK